MAREPRAGPMRAAFTSGVESLLQILASLEGGDCAAANREHALADLSMMVGALLLARATADRPLSDEFLLAARRRLAAGDAPRPPEA